MFVRRVREPRIATIPNDPVGGREILRIARPRPPTATIAGILLFAGTAVGMLQAAVLLTSSGTVQETYRRFAARTPATPEQIAASTDAVGSAYLASGTGVALLAVASTVFGIGVLRRPGPVARVGAVTVAIATLCFGVIGAGITALGHDMSWTGGRTDIGDSLSAALSAAYGQAVPGWLVGLTGGLTCVQGLGYIAVAALLLVPASAPYFSRARIRPPLD